MIHNPDYWYSHSPNDGASYPKFHYRRTTYKNGAPIHEELVPIWTTGRKTFLAILQLWNQAGMRANVNHLTHTYVEVHQ
jgi:hypothetical protein